jgi:D-arabinose 1-dehydrogenase-like Zn-dependent alcohol dehydrogenase
VVVAGATTGANPPGELQRVFIRELDVLGSSMGTLEELRELVRTCVVADVRPVIDSVRPLSEARDALARVAEGEEVGKLVLVP